MKVKVLAREALAHVAVGKREDGEEYYFVRHSTPEWVRRMAYHAHDGMLPDDWRYLFVVDALRALEGGDYDGDELEPSAYTCQLVDWLASSVSRIAYCDEACEDYDAYNMFERLQAGQLHEIREVFFLVRQYLEDKASEMLDKHAETLNGFYGSMAEANDD